MSDQHGRGARVAPWWGDDGVNPRRAEDFAAGLRGMSIEAVAWFDGVVTTPGYGWVQAPGKGAKGQWTAHITRRRRCPTALKALAASLRRSARTGGPEDAGKALAVIAILVAAAKAAKEET